MTHSLRITASGSFKMLCGRVQMTPLHQGLRNLSYAGGKVPPTTQNVINGQWLESSTDRWIDVHNPATNKVVTRSGFLYILTGMVIAYIGGF